MIHLLISLIALQIGIMLAVRPFVWWYFGINRAVRAIEDIAVSIRTLPAVRDYDQYFGRKPPRAA